MDNWGYWAMLDAHNIKIVGIEFDYNFDCTRWAYD